MSMGTAVDVAVWGQKLWECGKCMPSNFPHPDPLLTSPIQGQATSDASSFPSLLSLQLLCCCGLFFLTLCAWQGQGNLEAGGAGLQYEDPEQIYHGQELYKVAMLRMVAQSLRLGDFVVSLVVWYTLRCIFLCPN